MNNIEDRYAILYDYIDVRFPTFIKLFIKLILFLKLLENILIEKMNCEKKPHKNIIVFFFFFKLHYYIKIWRFEILNFTYQKDKKLDKFKDLISQINI